MDEILVMDNERQELPISRLAIGTVLVVPVVAVAAIFACHRMHQTPFMSTPERISVCGREYSGPGTTETLANVVGTGAEVIDHIWTWQGPREVWGEHVTVFGAISCGTGIYLRVSEHNFRAFALLGGP